MRPQIVKILTVVLLTFNSAIMLAQSKGGGSGPPAPTNQRRPPGLPIDDNILILICIGLLYGVYIAYKKHQSKNNLA